MQENSDMIAVETSPHKTERAPRWNDVLTSFVFFVFMLYFWGWRYGDYLFVCQENSMFVPRVEFLTRWMQTPDGFLSWISAFFLQFAYYPALGGLIYATLLLIVQLLVARLVQFTGVARIFTFLPSCCLAIAQTWVAYYVYLPYNPSINFAAPIALAWTLFVFAGYRKIPSASLRVLACALYVLAFYPLVGFWAPFALVLALLHEFTLAERKTPGDSNVREVETTSKMKRVPVFRVVAIIVFAVIVPCAYYHGVYYSRICRVNIFVQGLLEDVRYDKNSITAVFVYGFTILAVCSVFIMYLISRWLLFVKRDEQSRRQQRRAEKRATIKEQRRTNTKHKKEEIKESDEARAIRLEKELRVRSARLSWATLAIMIGATFLASYHNKSFFQIFKSTRALTRQDWQTIVELDEQNPFPIDGATMLRNVALYHLGRLGSDVFNRPIAGLGTIEVTQEDYLRSVDKQSYYQLKMWLFNKRREVEEVANRALIELVYCYWGQTNIGVRLAMNNYVAAEDRSTSCLMTLATAMLINGEDKLARRYLNELTQTLFYREWAKVRLAYLDSPRFYEGVRDFRNDDSISRVIDDSRARRARAASFEEAANKYGVAADLVVEVAAFTEKLRSMRPLHNKSTLRVFPNLVFLAGVVDVDEFDEADAARQELILVSLLLQKKGEQFLKRADSYMKKFSAGTAPKGIEQGYATWRYQTYDKAWQECEYKFSQETLDQFAPFIDFFKEQHAANMLATPQIQDAMRNYCRGTYWAFAVDDSVYNHY